MTSVRLCDGCGELPLVDAHGQAIPLKRCSRCRLAFYHNTACQLKHFPKHKIHCKCQPSAPSGLRTKSLQQSPTTVLRVRVEERNNKGKCLVAVDDCAMGQLIGSTSSVGLFAPIVPPVLFTDQRKNHCAVCFRKLKNNTPSSSPSGTKWLCKNPYYPVALCSELCVHSSQPWLPHEIEVVMKVLDKLQGRYRTCSSVRILPTAILVARILLSVSRDKTNIDSGLRWYEDLMTMQDPESPLEDDGEGVHKMAVSKLVSEMLKEFSLQSSTVKQICQGRLSISLNEAVLELLKRIKINAFTITTKGDDNDDNVVGFGLFETPAFRINHSCCPNAVQSFAMTEGAHPHLIIHSSRSIVSGEEICISYNDHINESTTDRRDRLLKDYHFWCYCPRCVADL